MARIARAVVPRFPHYGDQRGHRRRKISSLDMDCEKYIKDRHAVPDFTVVLGFPRTGADGYSISYAYDDVGNRLTQDSGGGVSDYNYDYNDRLLEVDSPTETTTFVYDDNGNTTTKTDSSGTMEYLYNYDNRLTQSMDAADYTTRTMYMYDADGIRTRKMRTGVDTLYVIDPNQAYQQVVRETESQTGASVDYFFGDDLISMDRTNASGAVSYYHYDGLGSTRALTDPSGTTTDTYDYYAFGTLLASSGSTTNNFLFTGEQYDPNLGFYYLRARYMNPVIGRFSSMDSWGGNSYDPISFHKYTYTNNNPVMYIDFNGLFISMTELMVTSSIITSIATFPIIYTFSNQGKKKSYPVDYIGINAIIGFIYVEWGMIIVRQGNFDAVYLYRALGAGAGIPNNITAPYPRMEIEVPYLFRLPIAVQIESGKGTGRPLTNRDKDGWNGICTFLNLQAGFISVNVTVRQCV